MIRFKCKMCGGTLEIQNGSTVAECEYCGAKQTIPNLDDEKRANLYDRANHFRRNNEFDKAMGIYEQILNEDNTDAEAYWSLVLCRYGIEYVEDPSPHKRIPTVNRVQFTSIFDDDNYKLVLQYADSLQRTIYEDEAKAINEIQKGFLVISQKEEPFDVFICYKETDDNGKRTNDSVLAQDLYYQLKQEGFNVFFSRITLEDKLGSAYEPYIFAALNSAKVMVVLGTKPEYFNAVWVKNEWSRFLSLIKNGEKKMLIPAYRDMNPYDLPSEFSHLQAQDMSKLGFIQDLIRGVKKIIRTDVPKTTTVVKEFVTTNASTNTAPLIKRAFMFLEDGNWKSATEYCEKVLDIDSENADAYIGKLMAKLQIRRWGEINLLINLDEDVDFKKAIQFVSPEKKETLEEYNRAMREKIYSNGLHMMDMRRCDNAINLFQLIPNYKDSTRKIEQCKALKIIGIYKDAMSYLNEKRFDDAIEYFEKIPNYKDSTQKIEECIYGRAMSYLDAEQFYYAISDFEKIPNYKDSAQKLEECRKTKQVDDIYKNAMSYLDAKRFDDAIICFQKIPNYKDSKQKIKECIYGRAMFYLDAEKFGDAIYNFEKIPNYKDSAQKLEECKIYNSAMSCLGVKQFDNAISYFEKIPNFKDSKQKIEECIYKIAMSCFNDKRFDAAINYFEKIPNFRDSKQKIEQCKNLKTVGIYENAMSFFSEKKFDIAIKWFQDIPNYRDSRTKIKFCKSKIRTKRLNKLLIFLIVLTLIPTSYVTINR